MDHQLREGRVECVVREGQVLGGGLLDVDAGVACAGRLDERLGRVDGCDGSRGRGA